MGVIDSVCFEFALSIVDFTKQCCLSISSLRDCCEASNIAFSVNSSNFDLSTSLERLTVALLRYLLSNRRIDRIFDAKLFSETIFGFCVPDPLVMLCS